MTESMTPVAPLSPVKKASPRQAFQQHGLELAKKTQAPEFLAQFKQLGAENFAAQELPSSKAENWKYLNLNPLWAAPLALIDKKKGQEVKALTNQKKHVAFSKLDAIRVLLINGEYDKVETIDTAELSLCTFSKADKRQQALISEHLGAISSKAKAAQPFSDLNQALLEDGLLVEIKANQSVKKPILIEHYLDEQANSCLVATRILIVVQANSKARVIESFNGLDDAPKNLSNSVCEVYCGANSHFEHSRLQLTNESAMHLSAVHVALMKACEYRGFNLTLGSELTRNDLLVNHLEGESHCQLNGVYLPKNKQQVDFHTVLEHAKAHCTSSETFRGIINHQATATFNGRIHIHQNAQKTDARLSNKNLLLTNQATINTKPELEIYADDVVCAHGATVAKIEEESIFYLMSRGVPRIQAEILLSFGFINELFGEITDEALADELSQLIAQRFREDFSSTNEA